MVPAPSNFRASPISAQSPKTLLLKDFGASGLKIGALHKREIQPPRISPKIVRYPPLVRSFTQTHLCDTQVATYRTIFVRYHIKKSAKHFCDTITTSIARCEKYRCWAYNTLYDQPCSVGRWIGSVWNDHSQRIQRLQNSRFSSGMETKARMIPSIENAKNISSEPHTARGVTVENSRGRD